MRGLMSPVMHRTTLSHNEGVPAQVIGSQIQEKERLTHLFILILHEAKTLTPGGQHLLLQQVPIFLSSSKMALPACEETCTKVQRVKTVEGSEKLNDAGRFRQSHHVAQFCCCYCTHQISKDAPAGSRQKAW